MQFQGIKRTFITLKYYLLWMHFEWIAFLFIHLWGSFSLSLSRSSLFTCAILQITRMDIIRLSIFRMFNENIPNEKPKTMNEKRNASTKTLDRFSIFCTLFHSISFCFPLKMHWAMENTLKGTFRYSV